jgi:hypothetical protein
VRTTLTLVTSRGMVEGPQNTMEALFMFPEDEDFHKLKHSMETLQSPNAHFFNVVIWLSQCHGGSLHPLSHIGHGWSPLLKPPTWVFRAHLLLRFLMTNISTLHSLYIPNLYLFVSILRGICSYFGLPLSRIINLYPSSFPLWGTIFFFLFGLQKAVVVSLETE